ncbi:pseudouridine synthase [Photobacterium jeanii]|uniref:Pseudouridine synthase n=1 Tax=Photobacterium jeanii TaxID=858640 RepID=A0A178K9G9_9GAMM|nr:YqcC family protein [Photobacterium jeanii]OAN14010.1 pseudouridine synthase [Photobacterium jeanii]PST86977.1 YqcC family protein [Photobacterium jeanii]
MDKYQHCQRLLEQLQHTMQQHQQWQTVPPSEAALASVEPFAIDTLRCAEWLQWIFIPKMHQLVQLGLPLPTQFEIAPYVEEAMKEEQGGLAIFAVCREFDNLMKQK